MTTRIQPWTEPELMDREHVFEARVEKALNKTMRQLATEGFEDVLTAAATLPVDPMTEGSYSALQGAVMASWTSQVDVSLYPFLTSTFDESASRVVDGVQEASGIVIDQLTGTYADEILRYAYNRMVGIGEALWLNIRDQLVEGYNAGEGIPEIAERLTQVAGLTTPRALTVARTEIISAANNGSYLQMLDAGFDEAVTKVWLATEDTRTRLSHRHADNQGVELTGEFNVDIYSGDVKTGTEPMEFPGDPTATPGNIINCRCSLAFDFEDEAEEVLTAAKDFLEKDHPRDGDGKFKKKGALDKYIKVPDKKDPPKADAPDAVKVAWIATHKWDSMPAGQKAVMIDSITEPTWQKLSPELKEKILDAPNTTSSPIAKDLLAVKVGKLAKFQDEADDEADTDAPSAGRPVGGVDTKTGKALVPGKTTKLRVQLLYNTTFADGAIMAVRKDSGERIVWDEKNKKINRQKLVDGKFKTTESLSRGAAYAAWKDEDGWTIPDPNDVAAPSAETSAPQASTPAVGKPVKLKVQLIYQTPFDDGDVVAVNPTSGDVIRWDAKKKRMVVHHASGGTTEYTRGALYKEYKDADGWHLPLDKKAASTAPKTVAKKAVPAAPAPAPAPSKPAAPPSKKAVPKPKNPFTPAKKPFEPVPALGGENNDRLKAAMLDPDVPNGAVLFDKAALGQHTVIKKGLPGYAYVTQNNGDPFTVHSSEALDTQAWLKAIGDSKASGKAKDAALVQEGGEVSDYVASDASNQIYQSWDTDPAGEIFTEGNISVGLAKSGNLLFLDSTPNGGVGVVPAADVNSENIDKALNAIKAGKSWTVSDPIPEVDQGEINAPGGSDGVSAGQVVSQDQVADIQDAFDSALDDDLLFENDDLTVEKYTDTAVIVKSKKNPGYDATYSPESLTAEHLNDFAELNAPDPSPSASTVGPQAQALFEDYNDAPLGISKFLLQDGTFKVKKASSGNVLIYDTGDDIVGGIAANDVTPENLEKGVAAVKAGLEFQYGDDIPDVPTTPGPPQIVDQYLTDLIKQKTDDPSLFPLATVWEDGEINIIKGGNGSIGVNVKDKGFVALQSGDITPQKINQAIADAQAGKTDYVGIPSTPVTAISQDKADDMQKWAKDPGTDAGEEFHNGTNFKIYKAAAGTIVVYKKDSNGDVDVAAGGKLLFGDEITPEGIQNALDQLGVAAAPTTVPVSAPAVDTTPVGSIPDPSTLKATGQTVGTHGGQLYKDPAGNTWLFKPTSTSQKHLALAEVAAGKLHEKVGLTTPEMGETTVDGKYGMIQKIIPNVTSPYAGSFNAKTLTKEQALQLQKEHVFDWLVSNHDSNGSNILKDSNGNLIGIDKGQAFKFFGADTLDPAFNPNGHAVPIANQFFQQYIKTPLSVDINNKNQLDSFIKKIQSIPDDEFKAILRPYAEAAAKNGTLAKGGPSYLGLTTVPFPANDVEAFLDAAVARKNGLNHTFTEFYKKLDDAADGQSVDWKISAPPAPSVVNPAPVTTPTIKQVPLKLSHGVLAGKASQNYFDGQVIAENPAANERLVWNAKTKKYDVQVETSAGKWDTAYSYNKSAAYANLKDDSGWMTPSTPQVANSGTSAGDSTLAPNVYGAPQVHTLPSKTAAPVAVSAPKPKISVADLKAQADLSTVILPATTKASIWSNFRTKGVGGTSTVTLSSEPKDIFEGLLIAQAMHNKANPSAKLSLLQVLRLADVIGTEKAVSSVNKNLYEKKIIDWLQTPDGLKAAQKISDNVSVAGVAVSAIDTYNKTLEKFKEHHAKSLNPSAGWTATMAALPPHKIKAHQPGDTYPEVTTTSQGNKFGADMISKYGPIPAVSKSALRSYTGNDYHTFNAYMRSFGKSSTHMAAKTKEAAAGLRPSPRNLTVHRNSDTVFDDSWTPKLDQLQDFKGVVFTEDAFASTSNDGHTFNGKKYRFIIEVPEGTPIAWVDEFSMNSGETEFILGPGLKYEILEITGPGTGTGASTAHKTAVIRMRVVP